MWNDIANGTSDISVDIASGDDDFGVTSSRHSHWRLGLSSVQASLSNVQAKDGTGQAGYACRVAVQGVAARLWSLVSRKQCWRDKEHISPTPLAI